MIRAGTACTVHAFSCTATTKCRVDPVRFTKMYPAQDHRDEESGGGVLKYLIVL